ncbi:MAG: Gfo/Idh/MocA family oxidoreductase [Bacillota bacterium]
MAYKVGIVGCGGIAQVHGYALKDMKDVEIVSVADIKMDRALKFSEDFSGKAYDNFEMMLSAEKLDFLHICTPHYLHVPMAVSALKKGINVLMEKPVCTTREDLKLLKDTVTNSSAQFGVCFQNRYLPSSQFAYNLIESGKAGKLLGARGIVTWFRNETYYVDSGWRGSSVTEGGGVMINQAIHTLDLMIWLMGLPKRVSGKINNHHLKGIIDVEDTAEIFLEFEDSATGIFFASNANYKDVTPTLDIWCENMEILLKGEDVFVNGEIIQTEKLPEAMGKMVWGVGHKLLISDFYEKIHNNVTFPVTVDEASHSINAIFDLYKSSKGE